MRVSGISDVPQSRGLIGAGCRQRSPVWGKGYREYPAGVADEWVTQRMWVNGISDIPQPHCPIKATGGQGVPVRGERDPENCVIVPGQLSQPPRSARVG